MAVSAWFWRCGSKGAIAFVLALVSPGAARATERGLARLTYELRDPNGRCVSGSEFRARVARRLGYDPFQDDALLDLRVRIDASASTVRAEVSSAQSGGPSGKRVLEDPKCDVLVDALTSAVALLLDPVAATRLPTQSPVESESAPAPIAPVEAAAPPKDPRPRDPQRQPTARESFAPSLYVDATLMFGRAPAGLGGARIGMGLRKSSFSISVEGHAQALFEPTKVAGSDRVDVSAYTGALVPCFHRRIAHVCGSFTIGTRQARALDVVSPKTVGAVFGSVGVRPGIELPLLDFLAFRVNAEVGVPFIRTAYVMDGQEKAKSAAVEGGFGIGLAGVFQ